MIYKGRVVNITQTIEDDVDDVLVKHRVEGEGDQLMGEAVTVWSDQGRWSVDLFKTREAALDHIEGAIKAAKEEEIVSAQEAYRKSMEELDKLRSQ